MKFSLHRLNPNKPDDLSLLYQAFLWETENVPVWYANANQVFGADTWEESLKRSRRDIQIDVAICDEDGGFAGLITVVMLERGVWETFISGPRKSDGELITEAAFAMAKNMFDAGIAEEFISWVCTRHAGALALNKACGMVEDGVTMIKGSSHGKPLEWKRLILTQQRMAELTESTNGRKEQDKIGAGDKEHLRLYDAAAVGRR